MSYIGSLVFNIFVPLWTFLVATIGFPFLFFNSKLVTKIIGYIWAEGLLKALYIFCGIKHKIIGEENIPEGGYIIASKHQSMWETIIFLRILKAPAYVLKKELLSIPMYGRYLKAMDMIAVDRKGGTNALKGLLKPASKHLKAGRPIVIFPEGTRTLPGEKTKYNPGIAFLYNSPEINVPIVPVALNSGKFWSKNSFVKKPGIITLEYLPPINPGLNKKDFILNLQNVIEDNSSKLLEY